jgi:hypothetical protein
MSVFLLFLLATSLGSLSTLYWIPEPDLGRGYFQMNALVILGLLALALAVVLLHPFASLGRGLTVTLALSLAGAFLYYAAIWRERWDLCRWPLSLSAAACLAGLLLAGRGLVAPLTLLPHRAPLLAAGLLASALLLGWSLITMLLGHWYLVAPRLTFRHLVVFCRALLAITVLRLLTVLAALFFAAGVDDRVEPHPLHLLVDLNGQGIFFWFRLLWGLAVPLLLAAMALHCARQRSNQTATGILYVLVVGTFIGEITGYFLMVTTGVPV